MNICFICGSPKPAKYSITCQTAFYIQKRFNTHNFTFIEAGARINALEKDFSGAAKQLIAADALLFVYPVYTFLAPSQLHRFIRLLKESGADLSGKYASQITTSKHFYDMTAHRFIEDNCLDLSLNTVRGLSADMEDLTTEKGRAAADAFFKYFLWCVKNGIRQTNSTCEQKPAMPCVEAPGAAAGKEPGHTAAIVADLDNRYTALKDIIDNFRHAYPYDTRLINIAEFPFKGGCLGCFKCAGDGRCVYTDGFDRLLREEIQTADAIVYAFKIIDHSMGCRFKTFDDRQFCNGHRTVTEGKPVGYLTYGNFPQEENLRTVIEARAQVGGNFLAGTGYDAPTLRAMAARLAYAVKNRYNPPRNFYGVGGLKIFRDLIWTMRGLMKADHQYYKAHGMYDFPQNKPGKMLMMCAVGALARNPRLQAKMGNKMNEAMTAPYKKIIENTKPLAD